MEEIAAFYQHCVECLRLVMHFERVIKGCKRIAITSWEHVKILRELAGNEFDPEVVNDVVYKQISFYKPNHYVVAVKETNCGRPVWAGYLNSLPLAFQLPEQLRNELNKIYLSFHQEQQDVFQTYRLAHPRVKGDYFRFFIPEKPGIYYDACFPLSQLFEVLTSRDNPRFLLMFWFAKEGTPKLLEGMKALFPQYMDIFKTHRTDFLPSASIDEVNKRFKASGNDLSYVGRLALFLERKSRELAVVCLLALEFSMPMWIAISIARYDIISKLWRSERPWKVIGPAEAPIKVRPF